MLTFPLVFSYKLTKRFELTLSDPTLIGKRRAAQRIAGRALELIGTATDDHAVVAAIALALGQLSAEAK